MKYGVALALMFLTACVESPPSDAAAPADSASVAADRAEPHADPARPGIRFDPTQLQPGDTVGVLIAESVAAERTIVDSSYVGVARFTGEVDITGWTMRHFESDLRDVSMCFEADSVSAATLPRWSQDERRPWFCFENETEARRELGAPSDGTPARIVIDRYTIHRGLSDQVNSARLVRVIRD